MCAKKKRMDSEQQCEDQQTDEQREIEECMCGFQFGSKSGFEKKKAYIQTIDLETLYATSQEEAIIFLTAISPIPLLLPLIDPLKTHLFVLSGCNSKFSLVQIQVCSLTADGCELSSAFHDATTENLSIPEMNRHIVLKTLKIYLESSNNCNKLKRLQDVKSPSESEKRFLQKYQATKTQYEKLSLLACENGGHWFESEFCFEAKGANHEIRQFPLTFFKGEREIENFEQKVAEKRKELFHLIFKNNACVQPPSLKEVPNSPKEAKALPQTKRPRKNKQTESSKRTEKSSKKKKQEELVLETDSLSKVCCTNSNGILKIDISRPKTNGTIPTDEPAQLMQIMQSITGLSPTNIVVLAQTIASLLEKLPS